MASSTENKDAVRVYGGTACRRGPPTVSSAPRAVDAEGQRPLRGRDGGGGPSGRRRRGALSAARGPVDTMTDETDDEMWLWMNRHEYRALNAADQARVLAALKRHAQKFSHEEFRSAGRIPTPEEVARADRGRRRRAERMSRPPYTDSDT